MSICNKLDKRGTHPYFDELSKNILHKLSEEYILVPELISYEMSKIL